MSRFGARALRHRQRDTFGFAVGDRVDHELADHRAGRDGRVMAVLNYGRVVTVQWADGHTANHAAHFLTPHVEGA